MKAINFSKHANDRLNGRMSGIVSQREIQAAVYEAGKLGVGETAIKVKRLPRVITVSDRDGSVSQGDVVIAVYRRSNLLDAGCVTTVELRCHWQNDSGRWTQVIDLTI